MKIGPTMLMCLLTPLGVSAQTTAPPDDQSANRAAIGVVVTPALEGAGPWLMPGLRLSLPLTARTGIDVDGGRVFGGVNKYGSIREFGAIKLRRLRNVPTATGLSRFWLYGLQYLPENEYDAGGRREKRKHHTAVLLAHGWDERYSNGVRLAAEIGVSGGDGLMAFVGIAVQWQPSARVHRQTSARDQIIPVPQPLQTSDACQGTR